jgi:hypothetical protein
MTTLQSSVSDAPNCGITLCGLYYKPMMIVNDDSRVINKLKASLTDDARVIIYDHHMFIVQATDDSRGIIYARVFNYAPREHLWYR